MLHSPAQMVQFVSEIFLLALIKTQWNLTLHPLKHGTRMTNSKLKTKYILRACERLFTGGIIATRYIY